MPNANPISGPYSAPASTYHTNPGAFNRTVLAAAPFIATGSNARPSAFYVTGSAGAIVTAYEGGAIYFPAASATTPAVIHEISVYSVVSGSVYLLYR